MSGRILSAIYRKIFYTLIDFILRPFRRNFGKDKKFYAAIDDMFGFIPNNIELYKLALIHKSASVMTEDGHQVNNERLEYLGDAVIESVTSDYLFIEYPDRDEGFLTQLRSKMVSRQTLNDVAKRIGLDDYVISHTSNNVSQKHIYGDAFEAMMGAIYLDQGYDFVNRLLINKIFVEYIKVDRLSEAETDFKSRLIEWCQKNHHSIRFLTQNDKSFSSAHPTFYSKVLIDNIEVGYGAGDSKKEAEQRAAYSVAQGVSDADCTMLMDKLDSLELRQQKQARDAKKESGVETKSEPKRKKAEERKEVSEAEKQPEPKPESKSEPKAKSEPKPKAQSKPKAEPKPKAEAETKPKSEPKSEVEPSAEPKPEEKKAPRRTRSRKVSAKADTAIVQEEVATSVEPLPLAAEGEDSAPKKVAKPRRQRTRKPVAKAADIVAEEVAEGVNSEAV